MSLQIINLQAENYKRLKAVNITPDGNVVFIGGKNAQGKTSVLDAIWAALAGGDASRVTKQPIRDGEDSARVRLDLGEVVVTRRWSKDDAGTLTVESGDGARYGSPQKMLDELIGARAFDPLEFVRQKPSEQVATLVSMVKLPFDPAELDRERAGVYDTRTEANRVAKQLEGQLAGLTKPNEDAPLEEVSAADIIAEFEKARTHNAALDAKLNELETAQSAYERADADVVRLTAELETAKQAATDRHNAHDKMLADIKAGPERIDTDDISERLAGVEQTNAAIREGQEYRRVAKALAGKKQESTALTTKLDQIDKQKADGLAAATFPIAGLSFDTDGVTFNGIPFSQASSAEQLRVSVALAMAANPKLRVLRILDGSLLDTDSLAIIGEMAAENDYQVWIEIVDESGTVGVVMEDGEVRP